MDCLLIQSCVVVFIFVLRALWWRLGFKDALCRFVLYSSSNFSPMYSLFVPVLFVLSLFFFFKLILLVFINFIICKKKDVLFFSLNFYFFLVFFSFLFLPSTFPLSFTVILALKVTFFCLFFLTSCLLMGSYMCTWRHDFTISLHFSILIQICFKSVLMLAFIFFLLGLQKRVTFLYIYITDAVHYCTFFVD